MAKSWLSVALFCVNGHLKTVINLKNVQFQHVSVIIGATEDYVIHTFYASLQNIFVI